MHFVFTLGTVSNISHYVNANITKCKKENSKIHVSQAFLDEEYSTCICICMMMGPKSKHKTPDVSNIPSTQKLLLMN